MRRLAPICAALAVVMLATAGIAAAVSDGNYDPSRQHCSNDANNYTNPTYAQPGCRNFIVGVSDGSGHEWASLGTDQTPDGTTVNQVQPATDTNGSPADFAQGVHVYMGADDNLDFGEHDSSPQWNNGPSDGGAIQVNSDPASVSLWLAALTAGDTSYLLTHPVPLVDAGAGMCADGYCWSAQTQRRVAFQGGDTTKHRDLANYDGKQWDPYTCAGPSDQPSDCGGKNLSDWNNQEGTVYAEPGVQVYEDPDAQGSPADPLYDMGLTPSPSYPIPSAYAGTCGVVAGGGSV